MMLILVGGNHESFKNPSVAGSKSHANLGLVLERGSGGPLGETEVQGCRVGGMGNGLQQQPQGVA